LNTRIILFGAIAVSAAFSAAQLRAGQNGLGGADQLAADFLNVSPSVRQSALGGAQAASADHLDSGFSNPAALTAVLSPELYLSDNESLLNIRYDTLNFALPVRQDVLSLSAEFVDKGSRDRVGIDSNGNPIENIGTFHYSSLMSGISWAGNFPGRTSLGVTFKGWRDALDGASTIGWAADAGAQARAWRSERRTICSQTKWRRFAQQYFLKLIR
jgi:hypothetical protein